MCRSWYRGAVTALRKWRIRLIERTVRQGAAASDVALAALERALRGDRAQSQLEAARDALEVRSGAGWTTLGAPCRAGAPPPSKHNFTCQLSSLAEDVQDPALPPSTTRAVENACGRAKANARSLCGGGRGEAAARRKVRRGWTRRGVPPAGPLKLEGHVRQPISRLAGSQWSRPAF